jgi:hypothetical protein
MKLEVKRLLLAEMLFLSLFFALPSQAAPSTPVDPRLVGVWELPAKGGRWVWIINPNGTYDFHSEAHDGTAPHSGSFSASAGHWSIRASDGTTDGGTYRSNPQGTFVATGRSGTAAWNHPTLARAEVDLMGNILAGIAADGVRSGPVEPVPDRSGPVFTCNPCSGPQ